MLVMVATFLVPIILPRGKRFTVPIVVGEIIAGIILGPSGLDLISIEGDAVMNFLLEFGLAYLMFIAGMEIDFNAIARIAKDSANHKEKGLLQNPIFLGPFSFLLTLILSTACSFILFKMGYISDGWMILALIISTTSLGVVLPVLKEKKMVDSPFGQTVLLTALLADFITMLFISIFASYYPKGVLNIQMMLVFLLFFAFAFTYRSGKALIKIKWVTQIIEELSHATAQIKLRASLVLLISFIVIAEVLEAEMILGAFIAGTIISLLTEAPDRRIEKELEAFGFSFFIPIFFVLVGVGFNLPVLLESNDALLLVPILLFIAIFVKMVPSLLFRFAFSWRETFAAGSLLSARLSLIIAASAIGLKLMIIDDATNSAIILVAITTVTIAPLLFNGLIKTADKEHTLRERGERAYSDFIALIREHDFEMDRDAVKAMFEFFDTNHDGLIDIEELAAVFEGKLPEADSEII